MGQAAEGAAVIEHAAALYLPTVYQWRETAEEGGLLAYGPLVMRMSRTLGGQQLIKLFRGARAADLPVEQPTHFELIVNLKTARAIGHDVPAGLVLRADRVIE